MLQSTLSKLRIGMIIAFVALINFALWAFSTPRADERPWAGTINSLSYNPNRSGSATDDDGRISARQLDHDMQMLAQHSRSVRTYSSSMGMEAAPVLAAKYDLNIIMGGWIGRDTTVNQREISNLIDIVRNNSNVQRVMVGNEAVLRRDITVPDLVTLIERVKRQVDVPVSTAEPWDVWLEHPELAEAADFITIHILPYWEGVGINEAIAYAMSRYGEVQARFPDKHIMIGEIGWPSDGQWVKAAEPSRINQAKFIRTFLNVATEQNLDYVLIEAFDQPWKRALEGRVGAHWGIWDQHGNAKFPMSGVVVERNNWINAFLIASLLALLPIIWFLRRQKKLKITGQIFYALLIQAVASVLTWATAAALAENIITANTLAWVGLIAAQVVLLAVLLVDGFELTEVVWSNRWRRNFLPHDWQPGRNAPKVSIHVPCYNEPPAMVIETLDALAALDYENFEVLVIDNNTKDPAVWQPLEAHCAKLGPRFRFFHLPQWPGYKAGALNFALAQTAKDVDIIGVIDSDYVVTPNWLRATVPYFDKAETGFVQAPQDYRDWPGDRFKTMCQWEYAGFFHIGMVQRNERNAIIQHGTMTLIRKTALQQVGGWAEWCICEDAELGLRLFETGYEAVYLNHSMGRGLIPDGFAAYKTQRFRWAYGAVQIIKRHLRSLLPGGEELTTGQRYHFVSGWLPWFADAAHMIFAIAAIFWSILLLIGWVEFPPAVFLIPTLGVFMFKIAAGFWLYAERLKQTSWRDRIGAALAGMALTHAVGRAVWQGLFTSGKPFFRTPKCQDKPAFMQGIMMAWEELLLLVFLVLGAIINLATYGIENRNAQMWALMLLVQSLPYWAALYTSMVNVLPQIRATKPPQGDTLLPHAAG
jgi:exo-beta-1,3-glucanase (GH17 family)/cellulose synthase/poly-beta-1,6-N-acetylglucosamine synthase-like glycosyltransferase